MSLGDLGPFLDGGTRNAITGAAANFLAAMAIMTSVGSFISFVGREDRFEDVTFRALIKRSLRVALIGAILLACAFASSIFSAIHPSFLSDALALAFLASGVVAFLAMLRIIYRMCLALVE